MLTISPVSLTPLALQRNVSAAAPRSRLSGVGFSGGFVPLVFEQVNHAFVTVNGTLVLAFYLVNLCHALKSVHKVGLWGKLVVLFEAAYCFIVAAAFRHFVAEHNPRICIIRVFFRHFAPLGKGFLRLILPIKNHAEVVKAVKILPEGVHFCKVITGFGPFLRSGAMHLQDGGGAADGGSDVRVDFPQLGQNFVSDAVACIG